jgi:hypothetical protein
MRSDEYWFDETSTATTVQRIRLLATMLKPFLQLRRDLDGIGRTGDFARA